MPSKTGVLLLQLGTADSPSVSDVRRYLREFLSDPRVLDMAAPLRALLLNAVILPFRPRRSAAAYRKIWTEDGSPLIIHTAALAGAVQALLGEGHSVVFGMRYGNPSIESALKRLSGASRIVVLPMFPQYASASGGSAVEKTLGLVAGMVHIPEAMVLGPFYDDPGFLAASAAVARPLLDEFRPDHILFSYHGLPEKQIRQGDPSGEWCLASAQCCAAIGDSNQFCYRAQCHATTTGLAAVLGLEPGSFSTSFQSRLAGQKWIEPYTDKVLPVLFDSGVRRLAVFTPSFAADCLETIEEIGIRGRAQWTSLGGEEMLLIPCVNAEPDWAETVAEMVRGLS